MSNQAWVSLPLKTVVGFNAPVGNMSLHEGKRRGSVVVLWDEGDVKLVERRGPASSGPLVEVPCKNMRVSVCR